MRSCPAKAGHPARRDAALVVPIPPPRAWASSGEGRPKRSEVRVGTFSCTPTRHAVRFRSRRATLPARSAGEGSRGDGGADRPGAGYWIVRLRGRWQRTNIEPYRFWLNQNRGSNLIFWRVFFTRTALHFARKRYSSLSLHDGIAGV